MAAAVADAATGAPGAGGAAAMLGVAASAGAAGAAAGAAGAVGGSGDVSTETASVTSDEALRNSRMLLPSAAPTSGSLPGPRIRSAMTRMMTSSTGPIFGMGNSSS